MKTVTILGAGISGLTTSFHVGHENCVIYQSKSHYGGHIWSESRDGFTWDDGPHVSFTNNEYVRKVLAESVDQQFEEKETRAGNYYRGHWIDHPAQSNLYQIPEPLRTTCLNSFLEARESGEPTTKPTNYQEWLYQAFGRVFADTFPAAYTRKYWTTDPIKLTVDWIGARVFYPSVEDVQQGFHGPLGRSTYWVKQSRYPSRGGFLSYAHGFARGANIQYRKTVEKLNFTRRHIWFSDGTETDYEVLVSTLPLPVLIQKAEDAPHDIKEAAELLRCSNLLLVNFAVNHPAKRNEPWIYVYDEDKLITRISVTELFSPNNAPPGCTGLSVEVYGSSYRPLPTDHEWVKRTVLSELIEMGLIESEGHVLSVHVRPVPWGNVIFDHDRRPALTKVNGFLKTVGVLSVGRFAEWKYHMTHDCVLSAKRVAEQLCRVAS